MDKFALQDRFLDILRKERTIVSIYLLNGIKLEGEIEWSDQFMVMLRGPSGQQAIYKRHVTTITPLRDVTTALRHALLQGAGSRVSGYSDPSPALASHNQITRASKN